ncbi:uncharacterized protein BT62DRAFT_993355 [Guyanagaster necrorhizus]|uniref:Uncharacterized protein n=1 Tax=Guyanagaster necrorhizus TaxID=856835 RepID=A0A9P8ATT1_9AGAR|nr:uncharacterized protein BT62DRAFT_993355 [Guyanagaster necrorhizus MCA 3950]KAG7447739.1 hypothetical protein BT62DRAFT_993355 [Guyanagaster necrorhizus MCA 3950]
MRRFEVNDVVEMFGHIIESWFIPSGENAAALVAKLMQLAAILSLLYSDQCQKLADLAKPSDEWNQSTCGAFLMFRTNATLLELRGYWERYLRTDRMSEQSKRRLQTRGRRGQLSVISSMCTYGTDPILPFHLAATVSAVSDDYERILTAETVVILAKIQLKEWSGGLGLECNLCIRQARQWQELKSTLEYALYHEKEI